VTEDRSERAPSSPAGALETFTVDPLEATYKRATGTLEKSTAGLSITTAAALVTRSPQPGIASTTSTSPLRD